MMPNLAADYDKRAQAHKPQSPEGLAAAIRELRAQGLTQRDISDALRMSVPEVIGLERFHHTEETKT